MHLLDRIFLGNSSTVDLGNITNKGFSFERNCGLRRWESENQRRIGCAQQTSIGQRNFQSPETFMFDDVMRQYSLRMAGGHSQTIRFSLSLCTGSFETWKVLRRLEISKCISRMFCSQQSTMKVKDCYLLLSLDWSATVVDVREAYLKLAKHYHPDCGRSTADASRFAQIQRAYRVVLDHVTNNSQTGPEVCEQDFEKEVPLVEHTAPQHR